MNAESTATGRRGGFYGTKEKINERVKKSEYGYKRHCEAPSAEAISGRTTDKIAAPQAKELEAARNDG